MKLRNQILVLFILLWGMIMLSGCSQVEKDFYALQKESSSLNSYVSDGEITLTVNQLPGEITEITGKSPLFQDIILKVLQDIKLTYNIKADLDRQLISASIYLKLYEKAEPREIFSIIGKEDDLYIRVDKIAEILSIDSEFTPYIDALDGKAYLTISREEMADLLASEEGPITLNPANLWNTEQIKTQNTLYYSLIDGLMNEVYQQYETRIVKKEGNGFSINLTPQEVMELIEPFVLYSLDHADQLEAYLISAVEDLTDEEMLLLELDPDQKEAYLQGITEFINEIKMGGSEFLNEWAENRAMIENEIIGSLGETKLSLSLQKADSSTYDSQLELLLQVKGEPEATQPLDLVWQVKDRTKKTNNFEVTVPQEGLISLTDFQAKIPWIVYIYVEPDYGFYSMSHGLESEFGDLEAVLEDGQTSVPFRQMADILNEEAGWDPDKHQAYVKMDGQPIYFKGAIQEGLLFVPVKEFEKVGWEISWDADFATITLIKYAE